VLISAINADGTASAPSTATVPVQAAPPVNTGVLPTIAGTPQRTIQLTSTQGAWSGLGNAYAYQWQRSADQGTTWTNINGATGATYTLAVADVGATVRLNVTATNPDGHISAASDPTTTVLAAPPLNIGLPTLSGLVQRSSVLTATLGSWSGLGNAYTYQWQRDAGLGFANITGATASTYTLGVIDEGTAIRVQITATNADAAVSASSAPTTAVPAEPPVNTAAPTIAGTPQRSATLTSTQGAWSGVGNSYAEQWQRSGDGGGTWTNISGATGSTYTLGTADNGDQVRLQVTATNPDATASAASAPTATVLANLPVNNTAPTIAGTPQRTIQLTSTQGSWSGAGNAYAYQWQRSIDLGQTWTSINGATSATYTLAFADEGANVRLFVTATNPDGVVTASSAPSAAVQTAPPANTSVPTITGAARLGATDTASVGNWTPAASFSYDWQRGNASGGYHDIAGATSASYTLQPADVGLLLQVIVTATNVDGTASGTSAATATVAAPPQNTVAPVAPTGTLMEADTLTAASGTWDTPSATFAYAWLRCPAAATSVTASCAQVGSGPGYALVDADVGSSIGVSVTAFSAGGQTTVDSALTAAISGLPLTNTRPPSIGGNPQVAQTLTANPGQWSVTVSSVSYTWERCAPDGVSNCGAVSSSPEYTLTAADAGHTIVLVATVVAPGRAATAQSPPLTIATPSPPQSAIAPTVTGAAARGHGLSASSGTWTNSPTQFAYQWERCDSSGKNCQIIPGATATAYVPTKADEGSTLTIQVTATNGSGTGSATATPTVPVTAAPPVNTNLPVIQSQSSIIQQGVSLNVAGFLWQSTPDTTYGIAWERCDATGANCQPIAGATSTDYTLALADVGHTLVAVSTATNADGPVSALSTHTQVTLPAAPRWKALPILSTDPGAIGDSLSITNGVWTGPLVSTETTQMMRCTNICATTGPSNVSSYAIIAADLGAILRVRETASNAGGDTVV
jgi:hypothetical protein